MNCVLLISCLSFQLQGLYRDCWDHPIDHIYDFMVGHVLATAVMEKRQKKTEGLVQMIF